MRKNLHRIQQKKQEVAFGAGSTIRDHGPIGLIDLALRA